MVQVRFMRKEEEELLTKGVQSEWLYDAKALVAASYLKKKGLVLIRIDLRVDKIISDYRV